MKPFVIPDITFGELCFGCSPSGVGEKGLAELSEYLQQAESNIRKGDR